MRPPTAIYLQPLKPVAGHKSLQFSSLIFLKYAYFILCIFAKFFLNTTFYKSFFIANLIHSTFHAVKIKNRSNLFISCYSRPAGNYRFSCHRKERHCAAYVQGSLSSRCEWYNGRGAPQTGQDPIGRSSIFDDPGI